MTTVQAREKYGLNLLKKPQITAYPKRLDKGSYTYAIQKVTDILSNQEGIVSVYQIGNVSTPGISDIDMLVVFEDGCRVPGNMLSNLRGVERYLFVHGLYGVPLSLFSKVKKYFFLNNYSLLFGKELLFAADLDRYTTMPQVVRRQISLEYLVKMFIKPQQMELKAKRR